MTDLMKIRLCAMINNELQQVDADISNELIWARASLTKEDNAMFMENVASYNEYKELLLDLRKQVEEGELVL